MAEKLIGANGQEVDSQGIPWREHFGVREGRRLQAARVYDELHPDNRAQQTPLPQDVKNARFRFSSKPK